MGLLISIRRFSLPTVLCPKQPDREAERRRQDHGDNQRQGSLQWIWMHHTPLTQASTHSQGGQPDDEQPLNFGQGLFVSCCL